VMRGLNHPGTSVIFTVIDYD